MEISLEECRKLFDRIAELVRENEELREAVSCPPHWMHWVNVKNRLPNCNGRYLVFKPHYSPDHGDVTICYFDGTDTWHDDDMVNFEKLLSPTDVTHWIPLPEPPEK